MTTIDADSLRAMQLEDRPFILIDTLPLASYNKSHLPGAVHIVSDDITAIAPARLPDKNVLIIVYCASGKCKRAGLSAERLEALGYTRVMHFVGGKKEWMKAGYPMQ